MRGEERMKEERHSLASRNTFPVQMGSGDLNPGLRKRLMMCLPGNDTARPCLLLCIHFLIYSLNNHMITKVGEELTFTVLP